MYDILFPAPKKNLANVLMAIVIIVSVVLILTVLFKYLVRRRAVGKSQS